MNALVQLLNTVGRFLSGHEVPHAVVGGITVALWGRPRATEDIDLLIDIAEEDVGEFVAYLADHDIGHDVDAIRAAARDGGSFALEDTWSIHWIDARTPRDDFDRLVLDRAQQIEVHKERFMVAAPEEVVLAKLRLVSQIDAARASASEAKDAENEVRWQDRRATHLMDARSILERQSERIDMRHLEDHIAAFGLGEVWASVRAVV